jgi:hypothetical protein
MQQGVRCRYVIAEEATIKDYENGHNNIIGNA